MQKEGSKGGNIGQVLSKLQVETSAYLGRSGLTAMDLVVTRYLCMVNLNEGYNWSSYNPWMPWVGHSLSNPMRLNDRVQRQAEYEVPSTSTTRSHELSCNIIKGHDLGREFKRQFIKNNPLNYCASTPCPGLKLLDKCESWGINCLTIWGVTGQCVLVLIYDVWGVGADH